MSASERHEQQLFRSLLDGLSQLGDVTTYGAARNRTATAFFNVAAHEPRAVAEHLAERHVNVWNGDNYAYELTRALGISESGSAVRAGSSITTINPMWTGCPSLRPRRAVHLRDQAPSAGARAAVASALPPRTSGRMINPERAAVARSCVSVEGDGQMSNLGSHAWLARLAAAVGLVGVMLSTVAGAAGAAPAKPGAVPAKRPASTGPSICTVQSTAPSARRRRSRCPTPLRRPRSGTGSRR